MVSQHGVWLSNYKPRLWTIAHCCIMTFLWNLRFFLSVYFSNLCTSRGIKFFNSCQFDWTYIEIFKKEKLHVELNACIVWEFQISSSPRPKYHWLNVVPVIVISLTLKSPPCAACVRAKCVTMSKKRNKPKLSSSGDGSWWRNLGISDVQSAVTLAISEQSFSQSYSGPISKVIIDIFALLIGTYCREIQLTFVTLYHNLRFTLWRRLWTNTFRAVTKLNLANLAHLGVFQVKSPCPSLKLRKNN